MGRSPPDSSILVLLKQALRVFVRPVRRTETHVTPIHGHESALTTQTALQQSRPAVPATCSTVLRDGAHAGPRTTGEGCSPRPTPPVGTPPRGGGKGSPRPCPTWREQPTSSASCLAAQGPAPFPGPGSGWIRAHAHTPRKPLHPRGCHPPPAPTPFPSRHRGARSPPPAAPAQRRARRPPAHRHLRAHHANRRGRGWGTGGEAARTPAEHRPNACSQQRPPFPPLPPAPAPAAYGRGAGRAGTPSPCQPPRGGSARRRDYNSQQATRHGRGGKREAPAPPRAAALLCIPGVVVARLCPAGGHFESRGAGKISRACRNAGLRLPLRRGRGTTAPRVHRATRPPPAILRPARRRGVLGAAAGAGSGLTRAPRRAPGAGGWERQRWLRRCGGRGTTAAPRAARRREGAGGAGTAPPA